MPPRLSPPFLLPLGLLVGCLPSLPPPLKTCEQDNACATTGLAFTSGEESPTTSDSVHTVTGDSSGVSDEDSTASTGQPIGPPMIVDSVVIPDYIDINGLLEVAVTTQDAEGVRMLLTGGEPIELTQVQPDQFIGTIPAFTGLDNGKHMALFTPWRETLVGESVPADYVIALPPPGYQMGWHVDGLDGNVAAIDVLPDGNPVEFGTFKEQGEPRCYLLLRDKNGEPLEKLVPVLESLYCRAIDLKIDRDTGRMHLLVEREIAGDVVWWAGEISSWGGELKKVGTGEVGDTALALAARPDVVAVCGSRAVATDDKLDALAVLLRPDLPTEVRLFDHDPKLVAHQFAETIRDCTFAGDTLVLVGEAWGKHEEAVPPVYRDRLMIIESALAATDDSVWTVAGLAQGVQTRALALDVDDEGRYHLAGYTCLDACEPAGEVWVYEPGGKLADYIHLGPLGSPWFGPHDIAWSPAGYAVVTVGEVQGQALVFKVQAVAPGFALPLWSFVPKDKQDLQIAIAVAVGPYGEVYAGGIGGATEHPAFARIGG